MATITASSSLATELISRAPDPEATSRHCGDSRGAKVEDCVAVGVPKKMFRLRL